MKRHQTVVIALVGAVAFAAQWQTASAQRVTRIASQNRSPSPANGAAATTDEYVEELPPGRSSPGDRVPEGFGAPGYPSYGAHPDAVWHDDYWHHDGCGAPVSYYGGSECGLGVPGQFFFSADYIYARASFSDATAFVDRDTSVQGLTTIDRHHLKFDYESSYRFGGGYRLCDCGEEIRFEHTRLKSSAHAEAPFGVLIPLEPPQTPGGRVLIHADVDLKTYDLTWAKTIPLGGQACCDCADPCGDGCTDCCVPCAPVCPTWDITWSGGIRYAEVDWNRRMRSLGTGDFEIGGAFSTMEFEGVGAKFGFEGRRYFFHNGWLSAYLKGDLSLLWGELEFAALQQDNLDLETEIRVSNQLRQIIPVTEIEAGVSGQVTCNSRVSAGYFLSAWHDLGFRDDFLIDPVYPIIYDDANILGFDGFFARVEIAY